MPPCKNDPARSYAGTEPSPKGLGYCAHAEATETVRTGRDGTPWIVSENRRGQLSWVRQDTLTSRLNAQLEDWWGQLSTGSVMVVYKSGAHVMVRSARKTFSARIKDVEQQWRAAGADPEVAAVVYPLWGRTTIGGVQLTVLRQLHVLCRPHSHSRFQGGADGAGRQLGPGHAAGQIVQKIFQTLGIPHQ